MACGATPFASRLHAQPRGRAWTLKNLQPHYARSQLYPGYPVGLDSTAMVALLCPALRLRLLWAHNGLGLAYSVFRLPSHISPRTDWLLDTLVRERVRPDACGRQGRPAAAAEDCLMEKRQRRAARQKDSARGCERDSGLEGGLAA